MADSASTEQTPTVRGNPLVPSRADSLGMVHGLNAARGIATILVLVAHAGIPYMELPLRTTLWLVHDGSHSIFVDVLLCLVNSIAMPVFFLMAGLSAGAGLSNGSAGDFIRRRVQRLGTPFLVGLLTLVPVCYVLWGLGLLFTERLPMSQLYRLSFPAHVKNSAYGPFHLWFLEYLLLMSIALCGAAHWIRNWRERRKLPPIASDWFWRWFGSPWTFVAASAAVLCIDLDGAYRLHNSFLPDPLRLLHYAVFFTGGALLARLPNPAAALKAGAVRNLCLACLAFALILPLMMRHVSKPLEGWQYFALAAGQSLFVWLALFGSLGVCIRLPQSKHQVFRYLSESSFWVYLIHVPVVALFQLWLWHLELNVWIKLTAASVGTLVISLLSYEWCVRYSYLGDLLNGGRKRLAGVKAWKKEIGWVSVVTAIFGGAVYFFTSHRDEILGPQLETVLAGRIYRSHRLKPEELRVALRRHKIKTVISVAWGHPEDEWYRTQQRIAQRHGANVVLMGIDEHKIPSSIRMRKLEDLIRNSPKPILIEGNKTPTLGAFGAAVAVLLEEGGSPAVAAEQFSFEHFQLEGYEHCIVAGPIRDYDGWLASTARAHTPGNFLYWTTQIHRSPEQLRRRPSEETDLQMRLGAPRYRERLR